MVSKDFYKMCESSILGTVFSVKPKNWSKKLLKSPFFANFYNFVFLNAKFEPENSGSNSSLCCRYLIMECEKSLSKHVIYQG